MNSVSILKPILLATAALCATHVIFPNLIPKLFGFKSNKKDSHPDRDYTTTYDQDYYEYYFERWQNEDSENAWPDHSTDQQDKNEIPERKTKTPDPERELVKKHFEATIRTESQRIHQSSSTREGQSENAKNIGYRRTNENNLLQRQNQKNYVTKSQLQVALQNITSISSSGGGDTATSSASRKQRRKSITRNLQITTSSEGKKDEIRRSKTTNINVNSEKSKENSGKRKTLSTSDKGKKITDNDFSVDARKGKNKIASTSEKGKKASSKNVFVVAYKGEFKIDPETSGKGTSAKKLKEIIKSCEKSHSENCEPYANGLLSTPQLIGFYSVDYNDQCGNVFYNDARNLMYSLGKVESQTNAKLNLSSGLRCLPIHKEGLENFLKWLKLHKKSLNYEKDAKFKFISGRGTLSKLMLTPYFPEKSYTIYATKHGGNIYLSRKWSANSISRQLQKKEQIVSYLSNKFEKCVFGRQIRNKKKGNVTKTEFYGVFRAKLGENVLLYSAEVDGMEDLQEDDLMSKSEGECLRILREKKFVEVKTSLKKDQEHPFSEKLINYWVQSFLVNIEKIVIGFRNLGNCTVREIVNLNTFKLPQIENAWSAEICQRFLNKFLQFVKIKLHDHAERTIWKFIFLPGQNFAFKVDICDSKEHEILTEHYLAS